MTNPIGRRGFLSGVAGSLAGLLGWRPKAKAARVTPGVGDVIEIGHGDWAFRARILSLKSGMMTFEVIENVEGRWMDVGQRGTVVTGWAS